MNLWDAHAHAGAGDAQSIARMQQGVHTLLSCGTPQEARRGLCLARRFPIYTLTVGIHPWHADRVHLPQMESFIRRAAMVGEIGLDSVWCSVPLCAQRRAFYAQLDLAERLGKPVVLHTKGCEAEIARAVHGCRVPLLVHWYAGGEEPLRQLLDRGCYMTIGPNVAVDPAVQRVAALVPDDRILFETDGMEAVQWALGDNVSPLDVSGTLRSSAEVCAALRGANPQRLLAQAEANLLRLLGRA